jgi:predicted secreted protein
MVRNTLARRSFLCSPLVAIGAPGAEATAKKTRLAAQPQVKRDFSKDSRSHKVIFAAHCLLNQNARAAGAADFPSMMKPLLAALQEKEIGIIQLPCPELLVLGLGRDRDVPPLETIDEGLELPEAQVRLARLIDEIIFQIKEYQWQGFHIVGILGKNGSPSCGVETTSVRSRFGPGEGVFIRLLEQRLKAESLDIDVKGIDDHRQQEAVDWVSQRV